MSSAVRLRGKDRPEWRERNEAPLSTCRVRRQAVRLRARYVIVRGPAERRDRDRWAGRVKERAVRVGPSRRAGRVGGDVTEHQ